MLPPDTMFPPPDALHEYVPPPLPDKDNVVVAHVIVPGEVPASAVGNGFTLTVTLPQVDVPQVAVHAQ